MRARSFVPLLALALLAAPAEGQLRTPAPRVVASGGVRYSVVVDDSIVSTHATQHVAQAEAVSRQIVCQLVQLPCSVQYEVHQSWRVEPDWAEAGDAEPLPPDTVDGDGSFLVAPLLAAAPDSVSIVSSIGSLGDGSLVLDVGAEMYVYAIAWFGSAPYMCASRKGVLGVRRVIVARGSGGWTVSGWVGALVKRPATCGSVSYSSDNPAIASVTTIWADPFGDGSMRTKVGLVRGVSTGESAPAPLEQLRQG